MNSDEYFGGSTRVSINSNFYLTNKALVVLTPTVSGLKVFLPANPPSSSGAAQFLILNDNNSSRNLDIRDFADTATLGTITPQSAVMLSYEDDSGWLITEVNNASIQIGQSFNPAYDDYELTIASDTANYDIKAQLIERGWDGTTPISVTLTINQGAVVYSEYWDKPAITSNTGWPVSSILILICNGLIFGMGGSGGHGGICQLAGSNSPGQRGGSAIEVSLPTVVICGGAIYGGGGGGGGGAAPLTAGTNHGGGGGGGCPGGRGGEANTPARAGGNSALILQTGNPLTIGQINVSLFGLGGSNGLGSTVNGHGGNGGLPGYPGAGGSSTTGVVGANGGPAGYWITYPVASGMTLFIRGGGGVFGDILAY